MERVLRIRMAYNNVYLVRGAGGSVLVDTGPDYDGAWEALQDGLANERPAVVVATHGHGDHAGLGERWQAAGVPVALGRDDLRMAAEPGLSDAECESTSGWVEASGAPAEVVGHAVAGLRRRLNAREVARGTFPPPGSQPRWPTGLRFRPYSAEIIVKGDQALAGGLRALTLPGHTPGNMVVVDEAEGLLFSGDQLLPDLTPTPVVQASPAPKPGDGWRFRSLPAFRASLARLATMRFRTCYPGHGEPFADVAGAIALNLGAIDERTEKVFGALREGGYATLYELCARIYPRAVKRRFWQIVPTVQGHLDLLEEAGRVVHDGKRYIST